VSHAGKVEQGGGDMDRSQGKWWREQGIVAARGDEGGELGLNPNRLPFIFCPRPPDRARPPCHAIGP
jgi:hypothetical protein